MLAIKKFSFTLCSKIKLINLRKKNKFYKVFSLFNEIFLFIELNSNILKLFTSFSSIFIKQKQDFLK